MEIKIGFVNNPRELQINSDRQQDEVAEELRGALAGDGPFEIGDDKGHRWVLRPDTIAYVELGSSAPRKVGFA